MLQTLIKSNIPLIFVETEEPERFQIPETDKDLIGTWKPTTGIQYRIGSTVEKITSTDYIEAAMEYLSKTKKKFLIVFYGEPDYERLSELPDYHTIVFVYSEFRDYVGAVKVSLPNPSKAEYFNAFQKIIKPKQNKKLLEDFADKAIGMKLKDATNCFRYSYYTNTGFLENKHLFTKSNFLDIVETVHTFKDLGGFADFKKWFNERKFWYKQNIPKQKGVILYGQSGTGKSLCASCLGNEAELSLYKFDFTKVYNQYVGTSEDNIRAALKTIENIEPAIIWIEEINRLFSDNAYANVTHNQVLSILLEWLQEHNKNIFIVATANDTTNIPKELIRPGRFNKKYEAKMPNKKESQEILGIHLNKYNVDLPLKEGLTGAEIEQYVQESIIKKESENGCQFN